MAEFLGGLLLGLMAGAGVTYRLLKTQALVGQTDTQAPVPRARAFTLTRGKLKPKVNDEFKAWSIENKREVNH